MLVVDDDAALAEMLSIVLRNEGFEPIWCAHGDKALAAFKDVQARPGAAGPDAARPRRGRRLPRHPGRVRRADRDAHRQDRHHRRGRGPGGRRRRLRRQAVQGQGAGRPDPDPAAPTAGGEETDLETLRIGDLSISVDGHSVKRDGTPIQLTPLEFDLLLALARRPWQVFSREVLLEQVWGYRHAADTRLVNVHVQRLRSKIERDPEHPEIVVTVRGIGYKAGETATA